MLLLFLLALATVALTMALNCVQGTMGAGKTYFLVNELIPDFLKNTKRPIWTNLPLNLDTFLLYHAKSAAQATEWRERIHFIDDTPVEREVPKLRDGVPIEHDGKPVMEKRKVSMVREFWWFTDANSIVILDETADIWNALEHSGRPTTLQAYIRQHRHYKDDLWFCCQDRDDVDVQVRAKILFVWDVTNMKNEPMVPGMPLLRGLRWPVVWFRVRVYLGKKVFGRKGELAGFEPIKAPSAIIPRQRGFACYRSHAAANRLLGKKLPDEDAKNQDMETVRERLLDWLPHLAWPVSCLGGIVMAAYLLLQMLNWANAGFVGPWWRGGKVSYSKVVSGVKTNSLAASNALPARSVPPVASNALGVASIVKGGNTNEVHEKLLLITAQAVVTDRAVYRLGEHVAGLKLERLGEEGCLWGGRYLTWGEFLVCRQRLSGLGGGLGDRGELSAHGALAAGASGPQGQRQD